MWGDACGGLALRIYKKCVDGFVYLHQYFTNTTHRLFTGVKCWKESEDAEDGGPGAYHHDGHMAGLLLTRTHLELTQGG